MSETVLELIERRTAELHAEIERLVDEAFVAVGIPQSTVNRRRGQLRRHKRSQAKA